MNSTSGHRIMYVFELVYAEGTFVVERTIQAMAVILFSGLGVFGNMAIVVMALRYTARKNLHHLILNMTIADILIILVNSTMTLLEILREHTPKNFPFHFANVFCKIMGYVKEGCAAVSLLTLLVISIERFRATRMTVQRSLPYTRRQRASILAIIWLISLGITVYMPVVAIPTKLHKDYVTCEYDQSTTLAPLIVHNALILSALTTTIILTILTLRRLSEPRPIEGNIPEAQRKARVLRIRRVVKMVLSSCISYSICYFPLYIFKMWTDKNWEKLSTGYYSAKEVLTWWNLLFLFYYLLPIVNSCLSPLIYVMFLADFREAVKKLLHAQTDNERRADRAEGA